MSFNQVTESEHLISLNILCPHTHAFTTNINTNTSVAPKHSAGLSVIDITAKFVKFITFKLVCITLRPFFALDNHIKYISVSI